MTPLAKRLPAMRRRALGIGPAPTFTARRGFPIDTDQQVLKEWVQRYADVVGALTPSGTMLMHLDDVSQWPEQIVLTAEVKPK